ncbi:tryptophan-rich sensory protein [Tellurirhabdus bombi]|uniref:tryptophan-rich sensory protein n=1 Tax=Tellurirhabdus bombi TaxID=2907205 RepID=UPI001F3EB8B9|nr:tryptophan-rich sensory protein [Tellurirhabdus bombi]
MKNDRLRQFLVVFTIISVLIMNYLSQTLPIGGQTNGQVSDRFHTDFTPAGYAFSIWSIIYLGLFCFAIYQLLPSQRTNPRFRATGLLVIINGILNCLWLVAFQNEYFSTSVLIIFGMVLTALGINLGLRLGARETPQDEALIKEVSTAEKWLARVPFAIYFGWLTVASIANVSVWLLANGWSGWGLDTQTWSEIMMVGGLMIGLFTFIRIRSYAYLLVFTWAYIAIAVEQQPNGSVPHVAIAGAAIAAVVALIAFLRGNPRTDTTYTGLPGKLSPEKGH